jgi:hypothetical protein
MFPARCAFVASGRGLANAPTFRTDAAVALSTISVASQQLWRTPGKPRTDEPK